MGASERALRVCLCIQHASFVHLSISFFFFFFSLLSLICPPPQRAAALRASMRRRAADTDAEGGEHAEESGDRCTTVAAGVGEGGVGGGLQRRPNGTLYYTHNEWYNVRYNITYHLMCN